MPENYIERIQAWFNVICKLSMGYSTEQTQNDPKITFLGFLFFCKKKNWFGMLVINLPIWKEKDTETQKLNFEELWFWTNDKI